MSSISVQPAVGAQQVDVAVVLQGGGAAVPVHSIMAATGAQIGPASDASAQAFAEAVAALSAVLLPTAQTT